MDAAGIERLLQEHRTDEAIAAIEAWQAEGGKMDAQLHYLLGNAWRKKGNWQRAIQEYNEAVSLDPDSPAAEALILANDILAFYNKDLYNP
ncbi:MAG: tetratricopeptide repeat protein [Bacteroidales bacterium]|nr:tetratricopeptide repeat protein [Bacteroidales bacterium]